jgi:hypothetical protein
MKTNGQIRLTLALAMGLAACRTGETSMPVVAGDGGVDAPATGPDAAPPPDPLAPPPDSPPLTIPPPQSGSRIKAGRWQTEEGVASGFFWWDSQLGTECVWLPAAEGGYRCLPEPTLGYGPTLFSDPDCTHAVIIPPASDPLSCEAPHPPRYNRTLVPDTCPPAFMTGALGTLGKPMTTYFSRDAAGACTPSNYIPDQPSYDFPDPLPAEMLATGTMRIGPAVGRLVPVFIHGDDGAEGFVSWHDVQGGFDCQIGTASDGQLRCLPVVLGQYGTGREDLRPYADPACKVAAAVGTHSSCALEGGFLSGPVQIRCGSGTTINRPGNRLPSYYTKGTDGCSRRDASHVLDRFEVGAVVPPDTFEPATRALLPGGRLRALTYTGPSGTMFADTFWDTKLGTRCRRMTASDGTARCVGYPLSLSLDVVSTFFADDQCRVGLFSGGTCGISFLGLLVQGSCPIRTDYHHLTGHTGPTYTLENGACVARSPRAGTVLYDIVPAPPASLVEFKRVIP